MSERASKSGWVTPPDKPPMIPDGEAKTSRVAVGVGIAVLLASLLMSWWIRP